MNLHAYDYVRELMSVLVTPRCVCVCACVICSFILFLLSSFYSVHHPLPMAWHVLTITGRQSIVHSVTLLIYFFIDTKKKRKRQTFFMHTFLDLRRPPDARAHVCTKCLKKRCDRTCVLGSLTIDGGSLACCRSEAINN